MVIGLIWWVSSSALAYEWGSALTNDQYRMGTGVPAAWQARIDGGAASWTAGPGEFLRGADWEWSREADEANTGPGNSRNEVYVRNAAYFADRYSSSWLAVATARNGWGTRDIVFNTGYTWCTNPPSTCPAGEYSIAQVAKHEFGHRLGFRHEDDVIAAMNSSYPGGGDVSGTNLINEDDYRGLRDHYPGASTGINLALSKFSFLGGGSAVERWNDSDGPWTWDKSAGNWSGGRPDPILAIIVGTSSASALVEWRLAPWPDACFDGGTEYIVGTRTPTLEVGIPYAIEPNAWDLSSVPVGDYKLCAMSDPYDDVAETNETSDNNGFSQTWVEVVP